MTIHPGGPVADILDRTDEAQKLLDLVRQGRDVLVYGPRRLGKTSLLLHVEARLQEERLVFHVDCTRKETDEEIAQVLLGQLSGLHGRWRRLWDWIKEHLEATRTRIVMAGKTPRVELDLSQRSGRSIADAVQLIARVAESAGSDVAVVLDEWQVPLARNESISWQMRAVSQAHPCLQLVFSGSEPSLLLQMLDSRHKAYFNGLVQMPIQGIGVRDVIDDLPRHGIHLLPEAIALVARACGQTTLRLMEVLHRLQGEVGAAQARAAVDATVQLHSPDFERELARAKPGPQRRMLIGLARDRPAHPTGHEFLGRHGIKTSATAHGILARLRQLDILDEEGAFVDALFAWYLANDPDLGQR